MTGSQRLRLLVLILMLEAALWASLVHWPAPPAEKRGPPDAGTFKVLGKFSFDGADSLKKWQEKIFKGKTVYEVLREGERTFLASRSRNSSSGLFMKLRQEVHPMLFLTWSWKAVTFPTKKEPLKLAPGGQDDFSARLYVVFEGRTLFSPRIIEYLWDENVKAGSVVSSPFSGNVKLFVIRSGKPTEEDGGWRLEQRNLYEDYVALFGSRPDRPLGAIAIMSDSDNTGTQSEALFGEIVLMEKTGREDIH